MSVGICIINTIYTMHLSTEISQVSEAWLPSIYKPSYSLNDGDYMYNRKFFERYLSVFRILFINILRGSSYFYKKKDIKKILLCP